MQGGRPAAVWLPRGPTCALGMKTNIALVWGALGFTGNRGGGTKGRAGGGEREEGRRGGGGGWFIQSDAVNEKDCERGRATQV